MNEKDRGFILEVSQLLAQAEHYGVKADLPEGIRAISVSDTLATQWSERLDAIYRSAEAEQEHFYPLVGRLGDLVQDNPEFFGAQWGDSCLEKAADKLEELIGEYKQKRFIELGTYDEKTISGDGAPKPVTGCFRETKSKEVVR